MPTAITTGRETEAYGGAGSDSKPRNEGRATMATPTVDSAIRAACVGRTSSPSMICPRMAVKMGAVKIMTVASESGSCVSVNQLADIPNTPKTQRQNNVERAAGGTVNDAPAALTQINPNLRWSNACWRSNILVRVERGLCNAV